MRCRVFLALALALVSRDACAEVQRFALSPERSRIVTKIRDPFGNTVDGILRLRQGEARGDADRLRETAAVHLVIDAGSYDSDLALRDQDVQKYYLEVERYPVIRLESTGIENATRPASAEEPWQIMLKARVELRGVQREMIIPIRLLYGTKTIIAEGTFRFPLADFKIDVPRLVFLKAGDRVEVEFRIVGERAGDGK